MSDIDGGSPEAAPPDHFVRGILLGIVVFLVCVGLGAVGGIVYTHLQPTLYASKSAVQVFNPGSLPNPTAARVDPTRLVELEVSYAQSQDVSSVADRALAKAGVTYDHVAWASLNNQDAVAVTCYSAHPGYATRCADEYVTAYIANRRVNAPKVLVAAAAEGQAKIATKQAQADAYGSLVAKTDPKAQPARAKEYATKQLSYLSQISALTQQVNLQLSQARALASTYIVVQPAEFPKSKFSPTPSRNLVIGLLGGAVLGIALLLLWQQLATMRRARHAPRGPVAAPPVVAAPVAAPPVVAPPVAHGAPTNGAAHGMPRMNGGPAAPADAAPADAAPADAAQADAAPADLAAGQAPQQRGRRRAGRSRG